MPSDPIRTGPSLGPASEPGHRRTDRQYRDLMGVTSSGATRTDPADLLEARPLGHVPALDGLRAVAVAAVMLFHGGVPGTSGGFLGVSVFFTLSGFLITSLLLREWVAAPDARLDLRRFFTRRFRRLLPASWITIGIVVAMGAAGVWEVEQLRALRGDVPWTLAELVNWHFIAQGTSYGASQSAPSPLEHFWSLAIEEQFYVLLPLVLTAVLVRTRRAPQQRFRGLVAVLGLLAALSAAANGLLARSSIDRAYFGTDTRAAELLIGALLACAVLRGVSSDRRARGSGVSGSSDGGSSDGGSSDGVSSNGARLTGVVGVVGLGVVGLGVLCALVVAARLDSPWLYPWGLLATAVCTSAVILAALRPGAVTWLLALSPLVLLGRISYGVYLLHWPVFLWLNEARTGLSGVALFGLRVVVSLAAATAMFHLIEMPIRSGRRLSDRHALMALPVAVVLLLGATLWTTRDLPPPPSHLQPRAPGTVEVREADGTTVPPTTAAPTVPDTVAPAQPPSTPPTTAPPPPPRHPQRVLLVGDSVAASIEDALGDALIARGVSFATAAGPGCGIVTGDPADANGVPLAITRECNGAVPPNQLGAIEKVQPDLVVTLSSWEAADRIVDGQFHPLGTPGSDAALQRLYGETIARLTSRGAAVAFATMPEPVDGRTRVTDADRIRRTHHVNGLLDRVAAAHPGRVTVLPFALAVCPASPCPTQVDGVVLRPGDGAHFDEPVGARVAAERLADMIVALDLNALG